MSTSACSLIIQFSDYGFKINQWLIVSITTNTPDHDNPLDWSIQWPSGCDGQDKGMSSIVGHNDTIKLLRLYRSNSGGWTSWEIILNNAKHIEWHLRRLGLFAQQSLKSHMHDLYGVVLDRRILWCGQNNWYEPKLDRIRIIRMIVLYHKHVF